MPDVMSCSEAFRLRPGKRNSGHMDGEGQREPDAVHGTFSVPSNTKMSFPWSGPGHCGRPRERENMASQNRQAGECSLLLTDRRNAF